MSLPTFQAPTPPRPSPKRGAFCLLALGMLAACEPAPPPQDSIASAQATHTAPPENAPESLPENASETAAQCWDQGKSADRGAATAEAADSPAPDAEETVRTDLDAAAALPPCPQVLTPQFISALQRALAARELYNGPITGELDAATQGAIAAYQSDGNRPGPQTLTLQSARLLGLAAVPTDDAV